jgi:hypothetical protein
VIVFRDQDIKGLKTFFEFKNRKYKLEKNIIGYSRKKIEKIYEKKSSAGTRGNLLLKKLTYRDSCRSAANNGR